MKLTIHDVQEAAKQGATLVDIRKSTSFGAAFIHGSINIGFTESSANWLTMVVAPPANLVLVADYDGEASAAADLFGDAGYHVAGVLDGGLSAWAAAGKPLDHLPQLSVHSLKSVLAKYDDHILLDVRTPDEHAQQNIPTAKHIPIADLLRDGLPATPKGSHITTLCGSGYRSNIAGSFLKSKGFPHVYSTLGGLTAWRAAFGES